MSVGVPNRFTLTSTVIFCTTLLLAICIAEVKGQAEAISSEQTAAILRRMRAGPVPDAGLQQATAIGEQLLKEKRYGEAADIFRSILEKKANDSRSLYGGALALFNLGRAAEAEPLIKTLAEGLVADIDRVRAGVSPEQRNRAVDALVLQAVVLAVTGKDQGALKSAASAVKIAPDHFDAQFTFGRALYSTGDANGAAKAFSKAVTLQPANVRALFFLGTTLEQTNDLEGALKSYQRIIALAPSAAEGHLGIGTVLARREGTEGEKGIKELERAVSIDGNLYEARVALGRALLAKGRAAESVEHLVRAGELAPGNPEPHYQLSLAYRRMGLADKAAEETAAVKRIHEARRGSNARSGTQTTP
jgi:tetratricopeptide (TPR) repeat protein